MPRTFYLKSKQWKKRNLRNKKIPHIAKELRKLNVNVFDDWFSPGPEADDFWRKYEKVRGSSYKQALRNWAGKHVFEFDKQHIDESDIGVLVMPAGKSGHLELGYMIGNKKPCIIYFEEEPEDDRWDVMVQFAFENGGDVCFGKDDLIKSIKRILEIKNE